MPPPKSPSPLILVGAGLEYAAIVGLLAVGGWWLDGKWGTQPWLLLVGATIGLIGGTYKLWRTGRRFFD